MNDFGNMKMKLRNESFLVIQLLIGNSINYISFPGNSLVCVSFKYSHVTEFIYVLYRLHKINKA
jgi:hypothetical protein